LFLQTSAAGAAALGRPLTWMGNNLSFRRSVYNSVGGYKQVGFSVTEDFALLKAIYEKNRTAVRFVRDLKSLVMSKPVPAIIDVYNQRLRWAVGGRTVHFLGKALIALGVITHLFAILSFILAFVDPIFLCMPAIIFLSDTIFIGDTCRSLKLSHLTKNIYLFELLFWYYTCLVSLRMPFVTSISWKDIDYGIMKTEKGNRAKLATPVFHQTKLQVESSSEQRENIG
jgi:hypothetical protein